MKNEDIARAFSNGEIAKTPNFFIEEENGVFIVYSYGYHFPIAIKFNDGYLFNKNGYSQSTARHKNLILSYIENDLTEGDYTNTQELKRIIDGVKYDNILSKAELIEQKI